MSVLSGREFRGSPHFSTRFFGGRFFRHRTVRVRWSPVPSLRVLPLPRLSLKNLVGNRPLSLKNHAPYPTDPPKFPLQKGHQSDPDYLSRAPRSSRPPGSRLLYSPTETLSGSKGLVSPSIFIHFVHTENSRRVGAR